MVRAVTYKLRAPVRQSKDPAQLLTAVRLGYKAIWSMPWLSPDPEASVNQMSMDELLAATDAFPPGVVARQRTSLFYPAQVPDLIGIKDRRYLDRTGLQQQRRLQTSCATPQ